MANILLRCLLQSGKGSGLQQVEKKGSMVERCITALEKHARWSDYHPTMVGGGVQSLLHLPEPKNYAGERMTNTPEKLNDGFVG